jgi:hypothetical protein
MQRMLFNLQAPLSQHMGGSCPFPKKEKLFTPKRSFSRREKHWYFTAIDTIYEIFDLPITARKNPD